ncbi:MAG TPA: LamG domain-containing protein [Polyangiaceae bacterium]|nr:LamG domain-containing protein [Polyangiaceae bacterium]
MKTSKASVSRAALGGALFAAACSLTLPEEREFFGSEPGGGGGSGTSNANQGGAATAGGTSGTSSGGNPGQAGINSSAGAGGAEGGESGSGGSGAATAGAAGDTSGSGGISGSSGGAGGGAGDENGGAAGSSAPLAPFDPKQGLLAHYAFEETAGTTARDRSPRGNDGLITGSVTWVSTGKVGRALQLSGQQAYVSLPSTFMTNLDEVTLAIWFNQDTRVLWTRVMDFGSSAMHWMYFAPATVQVNEQGARAALDVANFITAEMHMATVLPGPGEWMHVALTWKKTHFACYINGELVAEDTAPMYSPGEFVALTPASETWRAWLGRSSFAVDPYFAGKLDEFRAYDRALAPEHVAALYALKE